MTGWNWLDYTETFLQCAGAVALMDWTVRFLYPRKRSAAAHPNHPAVKSHLRMLLMHDVPYDWNSELWEEGER